MEIKRGSTRIVFLIRNWAIKIPNFLGWRLFLHGLLANMQEKVFSIYPEVCPVIFYVCGGFLNVAKRARELTELEYEMEIQYTYPTTSSGNIIFKDADYYLEAESKPSSFGWVDGKIVLIDYGN